MPSSNSFNRVAFRPMAYTGPSPVPSPSTARPSEISLKVAAEPASTVGSW